MEKRVTARREPLFEVFDNTWARVTLDEIKMTLHKIEKGTYGFCEFCRDPISPVRLKALPFAHYCLSCQKLIESAAVKPPAVHS